MGTEFIQLNHDWNAEPNGPDPRVEVDGDRLTLSFLINAFQFKGFREGEVGMLTFTNCWRHRLGPTNDEGWYRGQCRFSHIAPSWGEFYEVRGDLHLDECPGDWEVHGGPMANSRHFLFYLRDETFECDAEDWAFQVNRS